MNVNCIHFYNGKCAHPCARGLFSNKPCVLVIGDVRVKKCAIIIKHDEPEPPKTPSKPMGPPNELVKVGR